MPRDRPDLHSVTRTSSPAPTASAMALLAQGIPLSLLLDLVIGPESADLLVNERPESVRAAAG
jgi:hypothetical protein